MGALKRIIVTGGAGFIGSNLVQALNDLGHKDLIIVDHPKGEEPLSNLSDLKYTDYLDRNDLFDALEKEKLGEIETIFHLGACTDTLEKDKDFLFSNNTSYSKKLFDYCADRNARFIYASSGATYGGDSAFSDAERNLKPLNAYGESKHRFDEMARNSVKKPSQWVGLKFFNVYGPKEAHKGRESSLVFQAYHQIMKNGSVRLFKSYNEEYKDGEQKRDFIYVKDVVKVILFFFKNPGTSGIFNVGTGKARTFLDLARAVFASLHKEPRVEFVDMLEGLRNQYQYSTEADLTNLRAAGYSEKFYELEEGVKEYVQNYLTRGA